MIRANRYIVDTVYDKAKNVTTSESVPVRGLVLRLEPSPGRESAADAAHQSESEYGTATCDELITPGFRSIPFLLELVDAALARQGVTP